MDNTRRKLTWNLVLLLGLLLLGGTRTAAALEPDRIQDSFDCGNVTEIPQADCKALVALYESTDGDNWTTRTDWLQTNTPCNWTGIECSGGRVTGFYLGSNQLSGPIPPEIGNLTQLTQLKLYSNQLNGPIPPEIGNLTQLKYLWLYDNQLSGPIPPEIGNLTQLKQLYLNSNQLSGPIPPEIGDLTQLTTLPLGSNQLSGPIPPEIGNLTQLTQLSLSSNQLSGSIPPEIGNLTQLMGLSLSSNQLIGSLPPEIGNLTQLMYLWLGSNQLSGSLPPEISNLTQLQQLRLGSNQLSGPIPPEIGNLIQLQQLYLSSNQLGGPLPSEIGNLTQLQQLYLSSNQLSGPLPPEIGNLTQLQQLRLGSNQLSSPLPPEMGNLTQLTHLWLYDNSLEGEIPSQLTAMTDLTEFRFHDTNWCVPPTGPVLNWLSGIKIRDGSSGIHGTGLICGQALGSLSGTVTLTDSVPAAGVHVNLYRSLSPWGEWGHVTITETLTDGTYQFANLGQGIGIDYRVQFVDPIHQLSSQYYDAQSAIRAATVITITPGVPRTGIDAVLTLPQPPAVEVYTGSGSVDYNPDGTAQITMPAPTKSAITLTRAVTCSLGAPTAVTLTLSTGPEYPMTNVSGSLYQTMIPAPDFTDNATVSVVTTCDGAKSTTTVGYITLYDPSGEITDFLTGMPVDDATVTLYHVPGWEPKTDPEDNRPNTCESHNSKPEDAPWSQPAPTHLGTIANADVTPTEPTLPYQKTTVDGYYGWNVSQGCWYVTVEAGDYETLTSPVVGAPPEVTDLDLILIPENMRQVFLPLVLR